VCLSLPDCVFNITRLCVYHYQIVCLTLPDCVFIITRLCVYHYQIVCLTLPDCVFIITRLCVYHYQIVCLSLPDCVFIITRLCECGASRAAHRVPRGGQQCGILCGWGTLPSPGWQNRWRTRHNHRECRAQVSVYHSWQNSWLLKGARAQKIWLKSTYLKIGFR